MQHFFVLVVVNMELDLCDVSPLYKLKLVNKSQSSSLIGTKKGKIN